MKKQLKNPIDDLLNPIIMDLSIPYYDDLSRISNSSLGWFIISPVYFAKMMAGEGIKLDTKFLSRGSRIHKYVLEKEDFWKEYRISNVSEPSSVNQKQFVTEYCTAIEAGLDHDTACFTAYKSSYSTNTKTDVKIAEESLKLADSLSEYLEEVKTSDNREKMSFSDLADLKLIEKNIFDHELAKKLIYPTNKDEEVYSEFHINWIHKETGLECKSLIDRLIINHNNKIIKLVDLKTTKSIYNFQDSMDLYAYGRQMAFYWKAIEWYFINILKVDFSQYKQKTYIVGISTNEMIKNEVRVFQLEKDVISRNSEMIDEIMDELKWHYSEDKFDHSKFYYINNGLDLRKNKWITQELQLTA